MPCPHNEITLFRVVLHLLVVFTEQLFAALVSSGGNRRLPLAALNNQMKKCWMNRFGRPFRQQIRDRQRNLRCICRILWADGLLSGSIRNSHRWELYFL